MNHLNGVKCHRIGIIAVQRGNVSFNGMSHCVHTGVCDQFRRHGFRQCTVHNCDVRRNVEVRQRILDTLFVICDNGKGGHFCGSAGGRGHCTKLCLCPQLREAERGAQIFEFGIRIFIEYPHCFCGIDRRTAAHCHDPVRCKLLHGFCSTQHSVYRRVGLYAFKQCYFHAGIFQIADCLVQKSEPLHGTTAHNKKSFFALQCFQGFQCSLSVVQISRQCKSAHWSVPPFSLNAFIKCMVFLWLRFCSGGIPCRQRTDNGVLFSDTMCILPRHTGIRSKQSIDGIDPAGTDAQ